MKAIGAPLAILCMAWLAAGGCKTTLDAYSCAHPDKGHVDAQGNPDPCHENDPAQCNGQCVPLPLFDWSQPALLWFGAAEAAPPCPDSAPVPAYEGYAGFADLPWECPACECEPPAVTCESPSVWTVNNTPCGTPASITTNFDPPPSWDGMCSSANSIPANLTCGAEPCAQSITVEPSIAESSPCSPKVPKPEPVPKDAPFSSFARACLGQAYPPCASAGEACAPAQAEGFTTCIYQKGDVSCPVPWGEKYVFFEELGDLRDCTPCACGEPSGSKCPFHADVYSDDQCGVLVVGLDSPPGDPQCQELPLGTALGSKQALPLDPLPGSCAPSGGEPIGSVGGNRPVTFCCLPAESG